MKKVIIFIFIVAIFIVVGLLTFFINGTRKSPAISPDSSIISPDISKKVSPQPKTGGYRSVWITVNDKDKLFLYSNLDEKLDSNTLATRYTCAQLVNGGFYDTGYKHIGLFVSEGETISQSKESTLFDGYFTVSKSGISSVTNYPVFSPRLSLQAGPILINDGKKVLLNIENDEYARRVVLSLTKENLIVFLVVYDQINTFSGPLLKELPEIIEKISDENNLNIIYALNLDGGAHSAFISDLAKLTEASTIGSFFCIKP